MLKTAGDILTFPTTGLHCLYCQSNNILSDNCQSLPSINHILQMKGSYKNSLLLYYFSYKIVLFKYLCYTVMIIVVFVIIINVTSLIYRKYSSSLDDIESPHIFQVMGKRIPLHQTLEEVWLSKVKLKENHRYFLPDPKPNWSTHSWTNADGKTHRYITFW